MTRHRWQAHALRPRWSFRFIGEGRSLSICEPAGWCHQWFVAIVEPDGTCGANTHSPVRKDGSALAAPVARRWATQWMLREVTP